MCNEQAVGIFDSGVGGLTVAASIMRQLPSERIVYLGDTARVPYGTKSPHTVTRYALACARILTERNVKLLVVACNTASAHAMDALRDALDIPVVGVVEPGARAAVERTKSKRIGIIGTQGTIRSGEYQTAVHALAPEIEVFCKACPLFVPLAEEGWTNGDVPHRVAESYLRELVAEGIDTLLLACTHYPLLSEVIAEVAGESVHLVDSAEATARVVADVLDGVASRAQSNGLPKHEFLVSDSPELFLVTGRRFLGADIAEPEWVDF